MFYMQLLVLKIYSWFCIQVTICHAGHRKSHIHGKHLNPSIISLDCLLVSHNSMFKYKDSGLEEGLMLQKKSKAKEKATFSFKIYYVGRTWLIRRISSFCSIQDIN